MARVLINTSVWYITKHSRARIQQKPGARHRRGPGYRTTLPRFSHGHSRPLPRLLRCPLNHRRRHRRQLVPPALPLLHPVLVPDPERFHLKVRLADLVCLAFDCGCRLLLLLKPEFGGQDGVHGHRHAGHDARPASHRRCGASAWAWAVGSAAVRCWDCPPWSFAWWRKQCRVYRHMSWRRNPRHRLCGRHRPGRGEVS